MIFGFARILRVLLVLLVTAAFLRAFAENVAPSGTAAPSSEAALPAQPVAAAPGTAHREPTAQRQVELELEEIEGATAYEIELKSVVTGKPSLFKMKKPLWRAKVKPGKYTMRLRSYDERGVAGEWAEPQEFLVGFQAPLMLRPAQNAAIKTGAEDKADIEFAWQAVPGAKKYRLDVFTAAASDPALPNAKPIATETVEGTSQKISLPVAQKFSWKVTAIMPTGEDGEAPPEMGAFTSIAKRLDAPPIETPMDRYVQKLNWEKPSRTETYTYSLSRLEADGKTWKSIDKKSGLTANEIDVNYNEPGGKYRLQVRAEAQNTEPSLVSKIEFDVFNGNRSPAAVEEARLRDSMEKPTSWYGIASYLVTNISYNGLNADGTTGGQPQQVTFPGKLGGTGRLGLGYFKPGGTTGFIGIADMSGLNIAGENVTYASLEAHYAKRYYWGVNQLRATGGLFYKEIPQTYQATGNKFEFKKISFMGPHVGADFWHPFSFKYGMQVNTRLYLATFTGATPNGQDIWVTPSFQLGLMGSMRLSNRMIGFAGWAHRKDQIKYKKGSTPSQVNFDNEVILTGNYLNFMLEYGF